MHQESLTVIGESGVLLDLMLISLKGAWLLVFLTCFLLFLCSYVFPAKLAHSIFVVDPQEGEKILDMCAAPGGKTTAIAILMKDKGEVIAADRSHNKVHLLNFTGDYEYLVSSLHLSSLLSQQ